MTDGIGTGAAVIRSGQRVIVTGGLGGVVAPQDPYALTKAFGEQLMDAAVRRSDISCISVRPSWVVHPQDYARYLAAAQRDPVTMKRNGWSYSDADDLADALVLAVHAEVT